MGLCDCELWWKDVDEVLSTMDFMDELDGGSILITGAAGLVCSPLVDICIRRNEIYNANIQIYLAGRWPEEMEQRFGGCMEKDYCHFVKYDASKSDNVLTDKVDYIVHGASNAHPAAIVKEPVETMMSNILGVKQLLEYANRVGARRLLYISSSEIYGLHQGNEPIRDDEYGYIDLLNPRNSYSVGKRAAETLCASYAAEYGTSFVVARPGHIYGPNASPNDNRVASAWSYRVVAGKDIVMKSDGTQIRSWCYCLDCASALLAALLRGTDGRAYNISNRNSVGSIKDLAEIFAEVGRVSLIREEASESEKKGFNPMGNSSLDDSGLVSIGWKGSFDLRKGIDHTVQVMKAVSEC